MTKVALIGAGGKMGCRLADNLRKSEYNTAYVEVSEKGIENLRERNLSATPLDEAVSSADIIILAVPDTVIVSVSKTVSPLMKSGAMMLLLDPAAAYAKDVTIREDLVLFITHPCHTPFFNDETEPEARNDYFGGKAAKQSIVNALVQGNEDEFVKGEALAKTIFGPILRSHRVTLEQMAILEPGLSETIGALCAVTLREAANECARQGVPYEVARDFILGHIYIEMAIAFNEVNAPYSDACYVAIEYGKKHVLQPNWKDVLHPEHVAKTIDMMLGKTNGEA